MSVEQTGGARIGRGFWWSVNWTWPFVTLAADESALTLRTPPRTYRLARANIQAVELIGPAWAPPGFHGVVFRHNDATVPPYVLFWSFDRPTLTEGLKVAGYPIAQ